MKLAVSEACTNAVQHAYAGRAPTTKDRSSSASSSQTSSCVVEVEDDGSGFELVKRESWEDGDRPGRGLGMGLTIVRSVTDEVQIESGGKGSRIAFSKKF